MENVSCPVCGTNCGDVTTDPEVMWCVVRFGYIPDVPPEAKVGSCAPVRGIAADAGRSPENPMHVLVMTKALKMAVPIFSLRVSPSSMKSGRQSYQ